MRISSPANNLPSGDSDREPTMDDLRDMKYLEMCIKEALRVLPTVPMIAREITEDTEVCK